MPAYLIGVKNEAGKVQYVHLCRVAGNVRSHVTGDARLLNKSITCF